MATNLVTRRLFSLDEYHQMISAGIPEAWVVWISFMIV